MNHGNQRSHSAAHRDQAIGARGELAPIRLKLRSHPCNRRFDLILRRGLLGKEPLRHAPTTYVERLSAIEGKSARPFTRRVRAHHELSRTAARIRDGDTLAGKIVRHAVKGEPRLHVAGNDLRLQTQIAQTTEQLLTI